MVYTFLLNMWIMRKVDENYLQGQVDRKRITVDERDMIIATPQVAQ